MGGLSQPVEEPGIVTQTAGQVFNVIPPGNFLTEGNDTLFGGALVDGFVSGGAGTDLLVLTYRALPGLVQVDAWFGYATAFTDANDYVGTLSFSEFERFRITGTQGNDLLSGAYTGNSTLSGGAGADTITLRGGSNAVRGGAGNDTVYGATLNDTVSGDGGSDLLMLDLSLETSAVNVGVGFNSANWTGFERFGGTLTAFNDTLHGGALTTSANGGAGLDLLVLDYSTPGALAPGARVWFQDYGGFASLQFNDRRGGFVDAAFVDGFERYHITGTLRDDTLQGGAMDDRLDGSDGNDSLQGGGGADTLLGGEGDDWIVGSSIGTGGLIRGGAGDDSITVWRMDDRVYGGTGDDRLVLEFRDMTSGVTIDLTTPAAAQEWYGIEAVAGTLTNHDDVLRLREVTGSLDGSGGDDLLAFTYARSTAVGLSFTYGLLDVTRSDTHLVETHYLSSFEQFDVVGSQGSDSIIGGFLADTLSGARGNDTLRGDDGADLLSGDGGHDLLLGDYGDDTLMGGNGRDTLLGADGDDVLIGGAGADAFVFDYQIGVDRISDFEAGTDSILLVGWSALDGAAQVGADVVLTLFSGTITVESALLADVEAALVFNASPILF